MRMYCRLFLYNQLVLAIDFRVRGNFLGGCVSVTCQSVNVKVRFVLAHLEVNVHVMDVAVLLSQPLDYPTMAHSVNVLPTLSPAKILKTLL